MTDIFDEIYNLSKSGQAFALCTIVQTKGSAARKAGTKMIVLSDGKIIGTIGGGILEKEVIKEAKAIIPGGVPKIIKYDFMDDLNMTCGGQTEVFIDPIQSAPELFIFGAGHVGQALADLAQQFGFKITLIDNRDNIPTVEHVKRINGEYLASIQELNFTKRSFIVILTHQHQLDEMVLEAVIHKEYAYLGMIGSKSKIATARKKLIKKNISPELLDQVNMPIGIKFNAQSPEEIALSIMAKMIDVKNNL